MDALGFSRLKLLLALVGAIAAPAVVVAALGAAWPTIAATVIAAGLFSGGLAACLVRHLSRRCIEPLLRVNEAADRLRRGAPPRTVDEVGAPLVRTLARNLNLASSSVRTREQLSQANLMSVENAFDRIHAVIQALNEAVILADERGRIVLANPSARRLVRGDGSPIEGQELSSVLEGNLQERVVELLGRVRDGEADSAESTGVGHGERFYDMSIGAVQSVRAARDFGHVVVLVDVTKNYEISRLKDAFLSSMSHEMRTPLTNICAFAEILGQMTPESGEDWREFVQIISAEGSRMKRMVDDVLDFARIENEQIQWQIEPVDLVELARDAIRSFAPVTEAKRIRLITEFDAEGTTVPCDRERLAQVMSRLVDNAVKFTPDGGALRVGVSAVGEVVEVHVADSGKGVPEDLHEVVFERFRQIGETMTEKPDGAGLGLAISRRIVDALGGAMWCENGDLGGATFRFALPVGAREAVEIDE